MSVINRVLNQLEQRGADTVPEQTMVRAVPPSKHRPVLPLLALALAGGVAAWQWMQMRQPVLSSVEGPQAVAVSAIQRQPAVAAPAPASAVISAPAVAASGLSASGTTPAEVLPPASRLSLELGSTSPRPAVRQGSALRDEKSDTAAARGKRHPTVPRANFAKPQPIQNALPDARAVVQPSSGVAPMKQISPGQHADAEFRKAVVAMRQGHIVGAIAGYEAALRLDAGHDAARQALAALLLEEKRGADAESVLQAGLKNKPEHTGFAMLLARWQVERGAVGQATETLEKTLPHADRQADYQAFLAALLQRQNRHGEAITHYRIALQLVPDNGVWLVGYGISLQAAQRNDDAREAFRRALESKALNPELRKFAQQKLREL